MLSKQFRFFVFTCRDPKSDFRHPLVDALRHDYETYYIWLRRRPVVSGPNRVGTMTELSLLGLFGFLLRFRSDDRVNIYFNTTNTYFPGIITLLRYIMPAGLWCLDMHDDLRYHNVGLKRWRETLIIGWLRRLSDVTVHAAPTLRELFPDSCHVGNASNILPVTVNALSDQDVLIIASFDERFDFDFVASLAEICPEIRFHLHGWTRPGDTITQADLTTLDARNDNIQYHGPYAMADLPDILSRYRVSIAPYRTDTLLTRYIDPLRFYHCLNAGLEVISTDIPQARYMADCVHIVPNVRACAETLAAVRAGQTVKQASYAPITWEQRADRLVEVVRGLPRTARLLQQRSARSAEADQIGQQESHGQT